MLVFKLFPNGAELVKGVRHIEGAVDIESVKKLNVAGLPYFGVRYRLKTMHD